MWGSNSQSSHGTSSKFTATKSPSCAPESKKHPDQITIRTLGAKMKLGKTRGLNIQPPQATSSTVQITSSPWASRSLEMMGSSWDQSPGPLPSCGSLCGLGSFAGHQLTIRPLPLVWIKVGWAACTEKCTKYQKMACWKGQLFTLPGKCQKNVLHRIEWLDLIWHSISLVRHMKASWCQRSKSAVGTATPFAIRCCMAHGTPSPKPALTACHQRTGNHTAACGGSGSSLKNGAVCAPYDN